MARVIKHIENKEDQRRNGEFVIGVSGFSSSHKIKDVSSADIKRVAFHPGEEAEAIQLFVEANDDLWMQRTLLNKSGFYPQKLYKSFIIYLKTSVMPDDVPIIDGIKLHRTRTTNFQGKKTFDEYLRTRIDPELLADEQSIFHSGTLIRSLLYTNADNGAV